MIGIEKLKALAEATAGYRNTIAEWPKTPGGMRMDEFQAAANPAVVLELIDEIKRLKDAVEDHSSARLHYRGKVGKALAERDRLKAENEVLRSTLAKIRDESFDLQACEEAADALADSRNHGK